jgi:hypothetical protein
MENNDQQIVLHRDTNVTISTLGSNIFNEVFPLGDSQIIMIDTLFIKLDRFLDIALQPGARGTSLRVIADLASVLVSLLSVRQTTINGILARQDKIANLVIKLEALGLERDSAAGNLNNIFRDMLDGKYRVPNYVAIQEELTEEEINAGIDKRLAELQACDDEYSKNSERIRQMEEKVDDIIEGIIIENPINNDDEYMYVVDENSNIYVVNQNYEFQDPELFPIPDDLVILFKEVDGELKAFFEDGTSIEIVDV